MRKYIFNEKDNKIPLSEIPDDTLMDFLEQMVNINLYGNVHPEKADQRQLRSIGLMFTEGVISMLHSHPEMARELARYMPGDFRKASDGIVFTPTDGKFMTIRNVGKAEDLEPKDMSVQKKQHTSGLSR